ncbi:hypothetical protein [Streptomyces purpurascens]|uniref:Asl1-like glycosyl hydrolase catalytic domain-containing protein n=1 Tax=Streptomyces purpurascens TaxID=1924 RepID=A0ABZ1MLI3_STREF|nr:hypothetical protein [Streptomyces purpurascens]MCE7051271.1 hypothetical protein [Streptomyces purpurascens]
MDCNRRTAMAAGLGAVVAASGATASAATPTTVTVTVQGEAAARTNIPVRRDRRASGGRYLGLWTTEKPPARTGWYATYTVHVPRAGVYALTAVATAPVETPHTEAVASYPHLSVNDGPFTEIARSQPHWYESPPAWGDLSVLDLGVIELRGGTDTLTFRVTEPTVVDDTTAYVLTLDRFTLRPLEGHPALRELSVPRHRAGEPALLRLALDGHTTHAYRVRYAVSDHHGRQAATGQATIAAGDTSATVTLPDLPPGHYLVRADSVTGRFARLPARPAVTGPTSRFGVNVWASSLVPPSRLADFAAALRDMGAGWVRDGQSWPAAEPEPGGYDTAQHDRRTRTLRAHGLAVLDVLSPAPEWAMTDASLPLPADLRHAYRYARRLAAAAPEALQLSNEPDVDTTSGTGDAHAAFVKAAALGIKDAAPEPCLVVLPGIAQTGPFQDVMLANDVVRYADVWAFHGYPDPTEPGEPSFPGAADEQHELARRHQADVPLWMTECGAFQKARPGEDLTPGQEIAQARYVVLSTVEGLAAGNDRQFWFAGPPLHDDGVYFGLLDRDFRPLPAYSAFAALTSLLGAAHFTGPSPRLPDGVRGFAFDSGRGERVTVVWADRPVRLDRYVTGTAYDMMGHRLPTGRPVTASRDPLYIATPADPPPPPATTRPRARLSPAEHIVLAQRFSARDAAPGKDDGDAPPPHGYRLGRRTRMTVDVYNFGATARQVTVAAQPVGGGWTVRTEQGREETRIRVPAGGRIGVDFTVRAESSVRRRIDRRLAFGAMLDDHSEVPASVALIHLR